MEYHQDNFPEGFDPIDSVLSLGGPALPQLPFVDQICGTDVHSHVVGGEVTAVDESAFTGSGFTVNANDILDSLCYNVIHSDLDHHQAQSISLPAAPISLPAEQLHPVQTPPDPPHSLQPVGAVQQRQNQHGQQRLHLKRMDNGVEESNALAHLMSDEELSSLNIKDLNRKLKERGLGKDAIEKLKQRRRTLKNRKYATDCREKKDTEVHTLEEDKDGETNTIQSIEQENEGLRDHINEMKTRYKIFQKYAREKNIKLKPRNIPEEYVGTAAVGTGTEQEMYTPPPSVDDESFN